MILLSVLLGGLLVDELERALATVQPRLGLRVLVPLQVLHELDRRVRVVPFLPVEAGRLQTERALQLVCPVMGHLEVIRMLTNTLDNANAKEV